MLDELEGGDAGDEFGTGPYEGWGGGGVRSGVGGGEVVDTKCFAVQGLACGVNDDGSEAREFAVFDGRFEERVKFGIHFDGGGVEQERRELAVHVLRRERMCFQ